MTLVMERSEQEGLAATVQKLRFKTRRDFWSFVAYMAYSRLNAYSSLWSDNARVGSSGGLNGHVVGESSIV